MNRKTAIPLVLLIVSLFLLLDVRPSYAVYENFNTYQVVDESPTDIWILDANNIKAIATRDNDDWINKNFSTGYFTDFTHQFVYRGNSTSDNSVIAYTWMISNISGTVQTHTAANEPYLGYRLYDWRDKRQIVFEEYNGSTYDLQQSNNHNMATWHYVTIVKVGTSIFVETRNDSHTGALCSNLSLTLDHDYNFDTLLPFSTWNSGVAQSFPINIKELDLNLPDSIPPNIRWPGKSPDNIGAGGTINLYSQGKDNISGLHYGWLATNESGFWKNYTQTGFFGGGQGRPLRIMRELYDVFDWHYANRIGGTYWSLAWNTDPERYYPFVGYLGIMIYARDYNVTCLNISRDALQDAYDERNPSTDLPRAYDDGGSPVADLVTGYGLHPTIQATGVMATINATFKPYYEAYIKGLYDYGISSLNFSSYGLYSNGTDVNSICVQNHGGQDAVIYGFFNCYKLTGNATYLSIAKGLLNATWMTRNVTTNLIPHSLYVTNGTIIDNTMKQSGAGTWMMVACLFVRNNNKVVQGLNITLLLKTMCDEYYQDYTPADDGQGGFWSTTYDRWIYRYNDIDGSTIYNEATAVMWNSRVDRAFLMASRSNVLNNATYLTKCYEDLINWYEELKDSRGLIPHSEVDTGTFWFDANIEAASTMYLYQIKTGNITYKTQADDITDSMESFETIGKDRYTNRLPLVDGVEHNFPYGFLIDEQENAVVSNTSILDIIPPTLRDQGNYVFDGIYDGYTVNKTTKGVYYNSPIFFKNITDVWKWANYTWINVSIPTGTTIQYRFYYNDTLGNTNKTGIFSFKILRSLDLDYSSEMIMTASDLEYTSARQIFIEEIDGSSQTYFIRALQFTKEETMFLVVDLLSTGAQTSTYMDTIAMTDSMNEWKSVSFTDQTILSLIDSNLMWRAMYELPLDTMNLDAIVELTQEMLFRHLEVTRITILNGSSSMMYYRALNREFMDSMVMSDDANFWRALVAKIDDAIGISGDPQEWRAVYRILTDTGHVTTQIETKGSWILLTKIEVIETVEGSSQMMIWRAKISRHAETMILSEWSSTFKEVFTGIIEYMDTINIGAAPYYATAIPIVSQALLLAALALVIAVCAWCMGIVFSSKRK